VLLTGALADVGDTVVAQVRANLAALLAEIDAHPAGGQPPGAGSTPATAGSTPATAGSAGAVRAAAGAGSRARGPRGGDGPDGADRAADGPATDDAAVPGAPPPGVPRCA